MNNTAVMLSDAELAQQFLDNREKQSNSNPRFCCVPFQIEMTAKDCEARRGENKIYYSNPRIPKPPFTECVKCNVWKSLPPQKKVRTGVGKNCFALKKRKETTNVRN